MPARVTPAADARIVRRFQSECCLEELRKLPGEGLQGKLYNYKATSFSRHHSWHTWFYERRLAGRAGDPWYREGTAMIDAMTWALSTRGLCAPPPLVVPRDVSAGGTGPETPCKRRRLPARVTPAADARMVRRFQSECCLEELRKLPGEGLEGRLYNYKATSFSRGQSWYQWFYKRRHGGRVRDPAYSEGTSLIDAMELELCAHGPPAPPPHTWFYKRRCASRAVDPGFREGTDMIDAMARGLCTRGPCTSPPLAVPGDVGAGGTGAETPCKRRRFSYYGASGRLRYVAYRVPRAVAGGAFAG